ncbi:MAG: hypothetical protein INR65_13850 [Gluconacetobacter diazotrophicus]|nr:hypothetical protein [Gluconacetobacter diazotrophicus]
MKNLRLGLIAAVTLSFGVARAAEPPAAAPERAASYRQEVRTALTERGWSITGDEAGKLTAERLYINPGDTTGIRIAGTINTYARLQIYLQADGKGHPANSAYASYCFYGTPNKAYLVYPPLALRDPKLTQEYRDIVAEARAHAAAGTSGKIAMK